MRAFSIFALLLVTLSFCLAATPASTYNEAGLEKRQRPEVASSETSSDTTRSGHNSETSPTTSGGAATATTNTANTTTTTTTTTTTAPVKAKAKPIFDVPPILTSGTLFYIAIAVTFVLWCSGFALDFLSDRQEQLAYNVALSKKHCGLLPEYPATLKA